MEKAGIPCEFGLFFLYFFVCAAEKIIDFYMEMLYH